jgi:class 3 adenylate cyclase/DNA-binding SARP family transcriptional activator
VEFRLLGPFEVVNGGGLLALGATRQSAALALLLARAPQPVSPDQLVDELWAGQPPASAQHAVQVYVSGIRKVLRAGGNLAVVRSGPSGYALELDLERIDARRFERLLVQAQRASSDDPARASELFAAAVGLWRGRPLAEFERFEFARREADRLEELHAVALEGLAETRLECGEAAAGLIDQITGLVDANPLRERPRRLLMLALYRCGRHAEALAAYRDAISALGEIGLQPSPELRALEGAILRHDPILAPPTRSRQPPSATALPSSRSTSATRGTEGQAAGSAATADGGEASPSVIRRKVVTALLCDVTGSTSLEDDLDPEALHEVLSRYWRELRSVIERHGGTVEKFIGDAVMAVFGIPQAHEDDALRALRAAAEIRDRLPAVADEVGVTLSFSTGVNTGLALVGEDENLAIGDAVNVAARLEQAAAPGEVLLGEQTFALVRDAVQVEPLEPLVVRGKSERVRAFRLLALDSLAPGLKRHFEVPLVGRRHELGLLGQAWDRTVRESSCHLFTLLGVAGVGKSRLVAELLSQIGEEATVLQGRCLHYGEGITFWPMIEALSPVGDLAQPELDRLRGGGAAVPEELFFEVRGRLEALSWERPVILHVDDLQWGQPMLLDLLDHVADLSRGAPILILCTARPELLEVRTAWGGGKLNATTALLEPLELDECEQLLDQLGDGLTPDVRGRVIATSQGNPLFLQEMTALAREQDTLRLPATIQALLAARLERLNVEERELLERGAIEGEVFHLKAIQVMFDQLSAPELESRLAALVRKELIRPHPAIFEGDRAFRFRHLLIRDTAYDALPKATRAQLHQRLADWLEENAGELAELDEIAGWHLEQTIRYRHDLRQDPGAGLQQRAAKSLHAGGRRAVARGDIAAARNLLERAHALATHDDALRAQVGVDLAQQLIEAGELARADALLRAAEETPDFAGLAALARLEWVVWAQPDGAFQTIEAAIPGLLARFARERNELGLAKAHMLIASLHRMFSRHSLMAEPLRLAADHARNAGDEGLRSQALGWYVLALIWGPADPATIAAELDTIERDEPYSYLAAWIAVGRAELARLAACFDDARRLIRQAMELFNAMGIHTLAAAGHQQLTETELSAGEPARALAGLEEADASLAEMGERGLRSTIQAQLGRVQARLGNTAAARTAIELAESLGGPDDVLNFAITDSVRARLALADGNADAAVRWARSAVENASRTDLPHVRADAETEFARVLSALGRRREAASRARTALKLAKVKGDRSRIDDARTLLNDLAPDSVPDSEGASERSRSG